MRWLTAPKTPGPRKAAGSPASARKSKAQNPAVTQQLRSSRMQCACGGSCPRCRQGHSIEDRLAVSRPGDVLEREADQVADRVLGMSGSGQATSARTDDTNPPLSRTATSSVPTTAVPGVAHVVVNSPGTPLDGGTRAFFEPRFGDDFGNVRVHADHHAAVSADAVNAKAYTLGNDIVFGAGEYAPHTGAGRRLIAHELAHVAQQAGGAPPALRRQERKEAKPADRATNYGRIHMRYNGSELIVYGDATELFRYGGSSGRPIEISEEHARECGGDARVDTYMSPRFAGIRNQGPIPEGTFRFSAPAIQEFSTGEQLSLLWGGLAGAERVTVQGQGIHAGDWGAGRVPLRPVRILDAPCGDPRARSAFFLHGGLLAGSSGCIDIGTSFDELAEFLDGYRRPIDIEVRYETQTPRVGFLTGLGGALAYQGFHFRHGPTLRLGAEFGPTPPRFVASAEYQAVLDWAGGALTAGVHLDVPMNSEDAFVRAGLRGGAEFRILHALYGQLAAGGFIEPATTGSGIGYEFGGGLKYDLGAARLGVLYNYLRAQPELERNQVLVELGLRW